MRDEQAQITQRGPNGRRHDDDVAARDGAAGDGPAGDGPAQARPDTGRAGPPFDGVAAILAAALDDLPGGLIALDADGRATHLNRAARAIVGRADGIGIERNGAIVLAASTAARAFAALLRGVLHEGAAGGLLRVPRRQGRASYTVLISPQPPGTARRDLAASGAAPAPARGAPTRGVMVLIHDPDHLPQPPPAMLRRVFGLTRREAELVTALLAGIGAAGFAVQAGISLNTVRYHLKSIYAKVGVRGQADLMRIVLTTVTVLGGERHAALWRAARE